MIALFVAEIGQVTVPHPGNDESMGPTGRRAGAGGRYTADMLVFPYPDLVV